MRRVAAGLAIGLLTVLTVLSVDSARAAEETAIRLRPGLNVVTWNGAAPHPVGAFADTPVTQIHRWDAVRQEWLSHFVGQDGATLPELHLLPRVQYLLVAAMAYELGVPDPIAGIDPHAALRFAAPPGDPLRFEAYWPNEDSPLEDVVVLRGEDERLSVRAEVAGGVGEVEVYWMLDGRLNHHGLASNDIELLPGKHDAAVLYVADASGQIAIVDLPRVVKLPSLDIPEMIYGVVAHLEVWEDSPDLPVDGSQRLAAWSMIREALDLIAGSGLQLVRFNLPWGGLQPNPGQMREAKLDGFERLFTMLEDRGLSALPIIYNGTPRWANDCFPPRPNATDTWQQCGAAPAYDVRLVQAWARSVAARYPQVRYWQIDNEPNLRWFWPGGMTEQLYPEHLKAVSLGVWYENPDAVIVAAGLCCTGIDRGQGYMGGIEFLDGMYQAGFGPYHDVNAIHYPLRYLSEDLLDRYIEVMEQNGDGAKPIWVTEMGDPWEPNDARQGRLIVQEFNWLRDLPQVRGAIVYQFRDQLINSFEPIPAGLVNELYDDGFTPKESYWAVREFLTGHPKPD